jgi:hypothetical protein
MKIYNLTFTKDYTRENGKVIKAGTEMTCDEINYKIYKDYVREEKQVAQPTIKSVEQLNKHLEKK